MPDLSVCHWLLLTLLTPVGIICPVEYGLYLVIWSLGWQTKVNRAQMVFFSLCQLKVKHKKSKGNEQILYIVSRKFVFLDHALCILSTF